MRNGRDLARPTARSPWDVMSEFDQFFERAFRSPFATTDSGTREEWFDPQLELEESKEAYLIHLDLPGVKQEDIKVDLQGRTLTISGERRRETSAQDKTTHRIERSFGRFSRSFSLPETVDVSRIEASLESGVLKLALPKQEAQKTRTIEIKSNANKETIEGSKH